MCFLLLRNKVIELKVQLCWNSFQFGIINFVRQHVEPAQPREPALPDQPEQPAEPGKLAQPKAGPSDEFSGDAAAALVLPISLE